jgi:hypothetical protein
VLRYKLGLYPLLNLSEKAQRWYKFADTYNDAEGALGGLAENHTLARQVLEFVERCQPVQDETNCPTRLEAPVHPHEVLDLQQHLLDANVHVSFYRALPNYLVGLGLCITFLGLAVVICSIGDTIYFVGAIRG